MVVREPSPGDGVRVLLSSWGVAWLVGGNGVEAPEDDGHACSRLRNARIKSGFVLCWQITMSSHQFLDLALIMAHDGLGVAQLQNDTTPKQYNVAAAGQKGDAVRNKDSTKRSSRAIHLVR